MFSLRAFRHVADSRSPRCWFVPGSLPRISISSSAGRGPRPPSRISCSFSTTRQTGAATTSTGCRRARSQGQAEARAIRNALGGLTDKVNVGLMMYVTQGSQNDNAYVRHAIKELNATNQSVIEFEAGSHLQQYQFTRREASIRVRKYGYLMHDVYNYLGRKNLTQQRDRNTEAALRMQADTRRATRDSTPRSRRRTSVPTPI
jgi:hypothetical protein